MKPKLIKQLHRTTNLFLAAVMLVGLAFGLAPVQTAAAASPISRDLTQANSGKHVTELLQPDGSLDLSTGYRGSLDLAGYQVIADMNGALRLAPDAEGDQNWALGYQLPGVDNSVLAVALDGEGHAYVGGTFLNAGGDVNGVTDANHLAMWDGVSWHAVGDADGDGDGGGVDGTVNSLQVDASGNLYVGGQFSFADGITTTNIAMWDVDGLAWSDMDGGVNNVVWTMEWGPDGSSLYVGGNFTSAGGATAERLAIWDGAAWSTLTPDGLGPNDDVRAIAFGQGSDIYIGGDFIGVAGTMSINRVARWTGTAWGALGSGTSSRVHALAWDGTYLYAGGEFTSIGGVSASRVARWGGVSWEAVGGGFNNTVYQLVLTTEGLYAGGAFTADSTNTTTYNRIALLSGSTWAPLEESGVNGVNNAVRAIELDDSGDLWLGGNFLTAGSLTVNRFSRWDGANWLATGAGLDNSIRALVIDAQGNVYAGGDFLVSGGVTSNYVAMWDGSTWHDLGGGTNGRVYALALDSQGNLYAGGEFTLAGGVDALHIAMWDGESWSALGSGLSNADGTGRVNTIVVDDDDHLYAGGTFLLAGPGGITLNRIGYWNGTSWSALGTEPNVGMGNAVNDLYWDGANLFAGGAFTTAGGLAANYIAKWNGSIWAPMNTGTNAAVNAVTGDPATGVVYIGGTFSSAGGSVNRLAYWDPTLLQWKAFVGTTTGANNTVNDLVFDGTYLYALGLFTAVTGVETDYVAKYDGSAWYGLSGGANAVLNAAAAAPNRDLYVGGALTTVGAVDASEDPDNLAPGHSSSRIGQYINTAPVAVGDEYAANEDTPLVVLEAQGLLDNDTDPNADLLTAQLVDLPVNGEVLIDLDGSFIYTPTQDFNGEDVFTYWVSDGGFTDTGVVTITVAPVNDAPVAVTDTVLVERDDSITVPAPGLLENDIDVEEDTLTAVRDSLPDHGTLTLNSNGSFTYTPIVGYEGMDYFTYHANDGELDSDVVTVTITIHEVNEPPYAEPDTYSTVEDTVLTVNAPGVLSNDNDIDSDIADLTVEVDVLPAHGDLDLNPDGSFVFTPTLNYSGVVTFTYLAKDLYEYSEPALVTINVSTTPDPPQAFDDQLSGVEDHTLILAAPGVMANDLDPDGDPITAILNTPPDSGSLTLDPDGTVLYVPEANFIGVVTFTYHVNDGTFNSNVASAVITIAEFDDTPIGNPDSYTTVEDVSFAVGPSQGVLANDTDEEGDSLVAMKLIDPQHGTLDYFTTAGGFRYIPSLSFDGVDTFTYAVGDGNSWSDPVTVTIVVTEIGDDPVVIIYGDESGTEGGAALTFWGTYTDPVAGAHTVTWDFGDGETQVGSVDGLNVDEVDHSFKDSGVFTVTLSVENANHDVGEATLLVTIANVAPELASIANQTVDFGTAVNLVGSFTDPSTLDTFVVDVDWDDSDTDQLNLAAGVRTFALNHTYAAAGTYTVEITLADDDGGTDTITLTVTVRPDKSFIFLPFISR